jgi:N-acyl homoserine lactone hydrolase
VNVELLNVGWITSAAGLWRQGEPFDRDICFPVPAYLIETNEERILVDTGLHPAAVEDARRHYGDPEALARFRLGQEQSIADQVDLATITKLVLTHLHFDHAGGLSTLPRSVPVIVQRREWEAGRDRSAVARNFYLPHDYASVEPQVLLIDGDHDLLGDGSIRLLLTTGHTPGHQSVAIGERLVLGVDVAHFASTLDDHRFPAFADDFAAQTASAQRLRALRDQGVRVLPGHDPDVLVPGTVLP